MNTSSHPIRSKLNSLLRWVDSEATYRDEFLSQRRSEWLRVIPFGLVHLTCLAVFWVGWSPIAVGVALAAYAVRMFAITGSTTATSPIAPFLLLGLRSSSLP